MSSPFIRSQDGVVDLSYVSVIPHQSNMIGFLLAGTSENAGQPGMSEDASCLEDTLLKTGTPYEQLNYLMRGF